MSAITNFLDIYCEEVDYKSFYRDVFPVGSFEEKGVYEDGKYNGITCTIDQLNSKSFYTETLGWSEDIWDFSELDVENGKYPKLKK